MDSVACQNDAIGAHADWNEVPGRTKTPHLRVLIVDDDPLYRLAVAAALSADQRLSSTLSRLAMAGNAWRPSPRCVRMLSFSI